MALADRTSGPVGRLRVRGIWYLGPLLRGSVLDLAEGGSGGPAINPRYANAAAPTAAQTNPPGMMPTVVPIKSVRNRTPRKAGTRFTTKIGKSRIKQSTMR